MKFLGTNKSQDLFYFPWNLSSLFIIICLLSPILTILIYSIEIDYDNLKHLTSTKLSFYINNTLILLFGVGTISLILGLSTAWVVARYNFKFVKFFEWALLLPAAVPAYIVAYCYTDFLDFSGPIQILLRDIFSFNDRKEYYFPEIRSMGGAIFVLSFVLYPYIYLLSKVAFFSTPVSLFEYAYLRGKPIFFSVALPIARPAIFGGLSLVLMETISDFGTVEFFAIETITLGIFNLWLGMNDFNSATQLAVFSFLFIITLLTIELLSRHKRRFEDPNIKGISNFKRNITGNKNIIPIIICLIPIFFGFIIPILILISQSLQNFNDQDFITLLKISTNTFIIGSLSALIIVFIAIFISLTTTYKSSKNFMKILALIAGSGYAFPGVILALGTSYLLSNFQNFPLIGDLLYVGSIFALVFSYVCRFNAIGYNAINSGINRLPKNIVEASWTLNSSFEKTFYKIILPLIKPSILVAMLLSFVDIVKELPITLLLRPFNFETLATYSYQFAKDEMFEQSALSSLIIVAIGIIPVIILNLVIKPEKFLFK